MVFFVQISNKIAGTANMICNFKCFQLAPKYITPATHTPQYDDFIKVHSEYFEVETFDF